jgi:hypothetical protein
LPLEVLVTMAGEEHRTSLEGSGDMAAAAHLTERLVQPFEAQPHLLEYVGPPFMGVSAQRAKDQGLRSVVPKVLSGDARPGVDKAGEKTGEPAGRGAKASGVPNMYIYHFLPQAKVLDRKGVVFSCFDPEKCTNEHFSSWQVAKAAVTRERVESLPNMAKLKVFALKALESS